MLCMSKFSNLVSPVWLHINLHIGEKENPIHTPRGIKNAYKFIYFKKKNRLWFLFPGAGKHNS